MDEAKGALAQARAILDAASRALARRVDGGGRVSTGKLDGVQPEAFELARRLSEQVAAEALLDWGTAHGPHEAAIAAHYAATSCAALAAWRWREADGLLAGAPGFDGAARRFVSEALAVDAVATLGRSVLERDNEPAGTLGLDGEHKAVATHFARFADERIAPLAEEIHRHDRLIPEALLQEMAELGVFGISIPEDYGGSFVDHLTLIIATEELSRASLGAGGSVITRPEIAAKAILAGGTEAQKRRWLPALARGEKIVSVAVTEPNAGSDVAALKASARKVEGGYLINGEKTWCTFAGRADLFVLLARTGSVEEGHRGLTLFLVEKPGRPAGEGDEYAFEHVQAGG
ncbi:MAG: acyl-CoA dehydrogenase, partial [Deltaproteobacteria bacterium]